MPSAAADLRLSVSQLHTQDLLPNANIHCMAQDGEGYLWYGTERAGLCRDNGYQIDVFRPSDLSGTAESDRINCRQETKTSDIYAGTYHGLFLLSKADYQLHATPINNEFIYSLLTDSKGVTWVGTDKGIHKLDDAGNIVLDIPSLFAGKNAAVHSLYEDNGGNIFALQQGGGILRRKSGEEQFKPLAWTGSEAPLQIVEDRDHRCYWVLLWDGVARMRLAGDSCILSDKSATARFPQGGGIYMLLDPERGNLWITTMYELYAYHVTPEGTLSVIDLDFLLPQGNKILDQLLLTRGGHLYVAGFTPHTFVISPQRDHIERLDIPAMRSKTGYPVLADYSVTEGELIWLWQGRIGLTLYDTATGRLDITGWSPERRIQPNSSDGRGIWAAKGNTLYHLWNEQGMVRRNAATTLPQHEDIHLIHDDGRGILTIATTHSLYRYSRTAGWLKQLSRLPDRPTFMAVTPDMGVYLVMGGKLYGYKHQRLNPIEGNMLFTALAASPDGTVWTATTKGDIYHYLPGTGQLQPMPYMHSKHDAPIRDIAVDGIGHIWTASDQCVREYNPQNQAFREFTADDPRTGVSYFYSIVANASGEVCLNGAGAICRVRPSKELQRMGQSLASPVLTSYYIDGEKHFFGRNQKDITLRHGDIDLRLLLSTLVHTAAASTSIAYRLEGLNPDWIYNTTGDNIIRFSNLPPGTYHLLAKATDADGCWGDATTIVTLISLPPWYATWWARTLFALAFIVIVLAVWRLESRIRLLHRLIARRREVKLDEIEIKREDIANEQWDEEFIRHTIAMVEEHLADSEYNVEALSNDLCMSRTTFYRRLQKQTGQSPIDFIRDIRLKKAATLLLQESNATIADISRKVGFASPKYFTKCFCNKFGVTPREYARYHNE